jgi:hypothetical protein
MVMKQPDWLDWHKPYDDPSSRLSRRLAVVQQRLRETIDTVPAGQIRLISLCAGQGRDVIPVLAGHPRRNDVDATLVELDPRNAGIAEASAREAGLDRVRVLQADAALTDTYADHVPADVILVCGIFGNITLEDIHATVATLPMLAAPGATVLWTRYRTPDDDATPQIRRWFTDAGFEEVAFDASDEVTFSVGVQRLVAPPEPFRRGVTMFHFFR